MVRKIDSVSRWRKKLLSLKKSTKDPVILCAFILCVLIYSNLFPVRKQQHLTTLCPLDSISSIYGVVYSNPVKNTKNKSYSFLLKAEKVCGIKDAESSRRFGSGYSESSGDSAHSMFSFPSEYSASGNVDVIVPEEIAEAYFPGKLYSVSKGSAVIFEQGSQIKIDGRMNARGYFVANKGLQLPWENTPLSKLKKIRAFSRLSFRKMMYGWNKAGGLFLALISGMREYTDEKLKDAFKDAGLSHILALSGMHLSLFSGISKNMFSKKLPEKLSLIFQFIFISIFVWFAGFSPSLFRAFISSTIVIIFSFLNIKKPSVLNILSLTFLIHTVIFPEDLFSLSFIFSYGAMLGITIFSDFFTVLQTKNIPFSIAQGLGGSLGAQSITCPVTLKALKTFSPGGIISTLFVSPLITIFIYSGLILFILTLIFPFFSGYSAFLMNILYTVIEKIVVFFSRLPKIQV